MDFNQYQKNAFSTARYPDKGKNIFYPVLGLCGESGEVAEKVKKVIRDNNGQVSENTKLELAKELGDVLWYIAALATELELDMNEIAEKNIEKLFSRRDRGKIKGSGDNR